MDAVDPPPHAFGRSLGEARYKAPKKVNRVLSDDISEMPKNWNRRFKHNRDKIKTGDIYELTDRVPDAESGAWSLYEPRDPYAGIGWFGELIYQCEWDYDERVSLGDHPFRLVRVRPVDLGHDPAAGRPAIIEPVFMNVWAGSWLIASVCIDLMKHRSSTIPTTVCQTRSSSPSSGRRRKREDRNHRRDRA